MGYYGRRVIVPARDIEVAQADPDAVCSATRSPVLAQERYMLGSVEFPGDQSKRRRRKARLEKVLSRCRPEIQFRRGVVLIIQSYRSPKPRWILSLKSCRIAAGDDACWSPSWCSSLPLYPDRPLSISRRTLDS